MNSNAKVKLSLRYLHPDLDPDEITNLIDIEPTSAYKKDEYRIMDGGRTPRRNSRSVWALEMASCAVADVDLTLRTIFDQLPENRTVWSRLQKWNGEIFVGYFAGSINTGFILSHSTMQLLVDRHLNIDFDIYYTGR